MLSDQMAALSFVGAQPAARDNGAKRSFGISRTWKAGQPQRINPPRRIPRVLILIQPTRQPRGIRRQEPADARIIVTMPVVMQATLSVEVLALKPQRLVEDLAGITVEAGEAAVGGVLGGPDDFAAVIREFLRRA